MNRFVIAEPKLCIGCNTCMAACTMAHKEVGLQTYPRLTVERTANGTAPILCRHCDDAPCAKVCPVNAITHENDSIVLNETVCIGCKLCAIACPFGAITPHGTKPTGVASNHVNFTMPGQRPSTWVNSPANLNSLLAWAPGVRAVAVKCDLCAFREDGPQCVKVCPTKAMFVVDDKVLERAAEAKRQAAAEGLGTDLPPFLSPEDL
jgi:hydrogenase-4 component A